jgi:1,2-diacylglycerol 3-alpha-glucosyltransferase
MPGLLERLPAAKLVVVGDGPYRQELEELTVRLGLKQNIIFAANCKNHA